MLWNRWHPSAPATPIVADNTAAAYASFGQLPWESIRLCRCSKLHLELHRTGYKHAL